MLWAGLGNERTLKTYMKYLEDAGIILTLRRSDPALSKKYGRQ